MTYRFPQARLVIFAREPIPGKVKTRLHPAIGAEKALTLYCAMLERILTSLSAARLAPLELCVTSNPQHKVFTRHCNKKEISLQVSGDLGWRMACAIESRLARADVQSVLLIGSDCPAVDADYVESALLELDQGKDVVFGPAEDGGYVLLGCTRLVPGLFEEIAWGEESVLQTSCQRLDQAAVSYALLKRIWDVDRPEDLVKLESLLPPLRYQ